MIHQELFSKLNHVNFFFLSFSFLCRSWLASWCNHVTA